MNEHSPINSLFKNDCYFSDDGGLGECRHVFLGGNDLQTRLAGPFDSGRNSFVVGELGYGTGLNLYALLDLALHVPGSQSQAGGNDPLQLEFWSVEKYPLSPEAIRQGLAGCGLDPVLFGELDRLYEGLWKDLKPGWNHARTRIVQDGLGSGATASPGVCLDLRIWYGDVGEFLAAFARDYPQVMADAWFLDGHDPAVNPDMWCPGVFQGLAAKSRVETSTFATFTAAGIVKSGLRKAGFFVVRRRGFGRKRHMIQGRYTGRDECLPEPEA